MGMDACFIISNINGCRPRYMPPSIKYGPLGGRPLPRRRLRARNDDVCMSIISNINEGRPRYMPSSIKYGPLGGRPLPRRRLRARNDDVCVFHNFDFK